MTSKTRLVVEIVGFESGNAIRFYRDSHGITVLPVGTAVVITQEIGSHVNRIVVNVPQDMFGIFCQPITVADVAAAEKAIKEAGWIRA